MERLTEWKDDRNMLAKPKFSGDFGSANVLCRLAEYEDFEEIFREKMTDTACEFLKDKEEFEKWLDRIEWIAKKCDEYVRAEEQVLLLRLPCKVGDTVYCIEDKRIWDCIVDKVTISRTNGMWFEVKTPKSMPDISAIEYAENDIGKTVFLTQSEAEQKLNEMESE